MRNHKFKLSDMLPNAWFYKLRDMGKPRSNHSTTASSQSVKKKPFHQKEEEREQPQFTNHRHSYYFTSEPFSYKVDKLEKLDKLYNSPVNPKSTDVHFPDLPRKSSRVNPRGGRRRRSANKSSSSSNKFAPSSVSAGCSCRATLDSVWAKTDSTPDYSASSSPSPPDSSPEHAVFPDLGSDPDLLVSWSSSCSCRLSSSTADIILDMDIRTPANAAHKIDKFDGMDSISGLELLPIRTKPVKFNDMVSEIKKRDTKGTEPVKNKRNSVKVEEKRVIESVGPKEERIKPHKEQRNSPGIRRMSQSSPGLKLRSHSPRIASKKIQAYGRKSVSSTANTKTRRKNLSDSFAVIKSSCDPQRDFRDSMVEMIVENNIRTAKDLEELLACYLSLNSNEYHDIIVKVFEQIWFDLTDIKL